MSGLVSRSSAFDSSRAADRRPWIAPFLATAEELFRGCVQLDDPPLAT